MLSPRSVKLLSMLPSFFTDQGFTQFMHLQNFIKNKEAKLADLEIEVEALRVRDKTQSAMLHKLQLCVIAASDAREERDSVLRDIQAIRWVDAAARAREKTVGIEVPKHWPH